MPDNKATNNRGTNLDVEPQVGGINPSAPTAGTEGWGQTSDERRVLGGHDANDTRAGQMKGNPGDHMAAASQREEKNAASNKRPEKDETDLSRLTSGSAHSMTNSQPSAGNTVRCTDVADTGCRWETSGVSEDEVVRRAEEHWRKEHGTGDWTEAMRSKAQEAVKHRQAA